MGSSSPSTLLQRIRATADAARKLGTLKSIDTTSEVIESSPPFLIRMVQNLVRKDEAGKARQQDPPRDPTAPAPERPAFNPFLPYDQSMHVQDLPPKHVLLLNKFNVVEDHVLVVTAEFEEQNSLLNASDFAAMWDVLDEVGGLAFYNAGKIAGASQRHKHLQVIAGSVDKDIAEEYGVAPFDTVIAESVNGSEPVQVESLGFLHAVIGMEEMGGQKGEETMRRYLRLLNILKQDERVGEGGVGEQPFAYNLLVTTRWMLMVPRREECFDRVSVNALGFVGCLLVRDEEGMRVAKEGGLKVLRHVGFEEA